MASDRGRPLPKFGEWDVKNPASADGFTVIFNKARAERKNNGSRGKHLTPRSTGTKYKKIESYQYPRKAKRKWFCCG